MTEPKEKTGWLSRLRSGLFKSTTKLSDSLAEVFVKQKLDEETLSALEDSLIASDIGPMTATRLVDEFSQTRFGKEVSEQEVKTALAEQITLLLKPFALPLKIDKAHKPFVILVAGVNGVGKTTTIGKLAKQYHGEGLKVVLAAGDTFRAAAVSQLKIWGERTNAPVIAGEQGSDSASVAFQALEKARSEKADVLLIDTAGRLHNKGDLMQELAKLIRVLKKIDPAAPHATLLVLDATTGQNALTQVEVFKELTQITGLIVTKLDGSAKGGVLVALADHFRLPIHAIGVGEGVDDLQTFDAGDFAKSLLGIG